MRSRVIATVGRSRLREPDVLASASLGPVEVLLGQDQEPLVLMPERMLRDQDELRALTDVFVRVAVAQSSADVPPLMLGEASFIADWPLDERRRFFVAFAEAIAASLRSGDPSTAREFLDQMARSGLPHASPPVVGDIGPAGAAALESRRAARRT